MSRLGCATASRIADVVAETKSGWAASRANYMAELIAERLTGEPSATYTNAAMQWGVEKEPEAKAAYEFHTDMEVGAAGFVLHPTIAMSGATPDGFVGNDGLIETKCPQTATHLETLLGRAVPKKYKTQINWQLACTGRKWCDYISFDPRMPESMRLFIYRIHRNDADIELLEKNVANFLVELDGQIKELKRVYEAKAAA